MEEVSAVAKELKFNGGENEEEDEELIPSSQNQQEVRKNRNLTLPPYHVLALTAYLALQFKQKKVGHSF